jgi:hypothetical protein
MRSIAYAAALVLASAGAALAQSSQTPIADAAFGPQQGSHEFTLSGTGSNDNDFDRGTFGVTGSYGYFMSRNLELSARQSINWTAVNNADDQINASTRGAVDYHFDIAPRWRPYVGANIGAIYGEGVNDTGTIGPEVGLKYYLNPTTFVMFQTEYQWLFEGSDDVDDNFDDGRFVYTLGMGLNF